MSLLTGTVTNVLISGNCINNTTATNNASATVTYNYFQAIVSDAYAIIDDNIAAGIASTTAFGSGTLPNPNSNLTVFILLNAFISKVTHNSLTRGATTISAYVYSNSTMPQIVVDNYFDSHTIDGTSISLDATTLAGSNYSRNINQTASISISLMDYAKYIASGGTGDYSEGNVNTLGGVIPMLSNSNTGPAAIQTFEYADLTVPNSPSSTNGALYIRRVPSFFGLEGSDYTWITVTLLETATTSPTINFSSTLPLDYLLPNDVKIVSATIGALFNNQGIGGLVATAALGATAKSNQLSLSLVQYINTTNNTLINGTSNPNTVLDVANNVVIGSRTALDKTINNIFDYTTIIYEDGAGPPTPTYQVITVEQMTSATQYCSVIPPYGSLVSGAGYKISVEVNLNFVVNSSGSEVLLSWYLSPIVVQYRW